MRTVGPHERYHGLHCRDCTGFPEGETHGLCRILSRFRNAGDTICLDGHMRKDTEMARWTPEEDATLREHAAEGQNLLAARLPGHTPGSIRQRASALKIGLGKNATAVMPPPVDPDRECPKCAHAAVDEDEPPCRDCGKAFEMWEPKTAEVPAVMVDGAGEVVEHHVTLHDLVADGFTVEMRPDYRSELVDWLVRISKDPEGASLEALDRLGELAKGAS